MRSALRLSLLLTALAGLAQPPAPPADHSTADHLKRKPEGTCSVSGRVVAAGDGTPLKSAHVLLVQKNAGRDRQLYSAATDSNGAAGERC